MGKVYKNDVGKEIRVDTGIDLSQSTYVELQVLTPTGETKWVDVTVTSGSTEYNETSGMTVIKYITKSGDLLSSGCYTVMAYVEFGSGSRHLGSPARFFVYDKWEPT